MDGCYTSTPNGDFSMSGFSCLPLEHNRAADFAVECWKLKYDLTKKDSLIKHLKTEVKELKHAYRKLGETNLLLRKGEAVKENDATKLEQQLVDLRMELEIAKRNAQVNNRATARMRTQINELESKARKYEADLADAALNM